MRLGLWRENEYRMYKVISQPESICEAKTVPNKKDIAHIKFIA